jgi:hypothetical protein
MNSSKHYSEKQNESVLTVTHRGLIAPLGRLTSQSYLKRIILRDMTNDPDLI